MVHPVKRLRQHTAAANSFSPHTCIGCACQVLPAAQVTAQPRQQGAWGQTGRRALRCCWQGFPRAATETLARQQGRGACLLLPLPVEVHPRHLCGLSGLGHCVVLKPGLTQLVDLSPEWQRQRV